MYKLLNKNACKTTKISKPKPMIRYLGIFHGVFFASTITIASVLDITDLAPAWLIICICLLLAALISGVFFAKIKNYVPTMLECGKYAGWGGFYFILTIFVAFAFALLAANDFSVLFVIAFGIALFKPSLTGVIISVVIGFFLTCIGFIIGAKGFLYRRLVKAD